MYTSCHYDYRRRHDHDHHLHHDRDHYHHKGSQLKRIASSHLGSGFFIAFIDSTAILNFSDLFGHRLLHSSKFGINIVASLPCIFYVTFLDALASLKTVFKIHSDTDVFKILTPIVWYYFR